MTKMFTDLDTSSIDREHAAIFVAEFLAWWFMSGRNDYGGDLDIRLFVEDAAIAAGWMGARRIARQAAPKTAQRV